MNKLLKILLAKGLSIDLAEEIAQDYFETKKDDDGIDSFAVEYRDLMGNTFNSLTEKYDTYEDAEQRIYSLIEGCEHIPGEATGSALRVDFNDGNSFDKHLWVWEFETERWIQDI